jgi:hypothetical protein
LKAPLLAVISVGIAAAAPAVAISAQTPSTWKLASAKSASQSASVQTDPRQPIGQVSFQLPNDARPKTQDDKRRRLEQSFLHWRKRVNRLIAKLHHRRPRHVRVATQLRWSDHALSRATRALKRRARRLRAALAAKRWGLTPGVKAQLAAIAWCESKGDPRAIGGGGSFRGKYQFTYGTWSAIGGHGDPAAAPEAEQDRRAALLLRRSGTSPWPICG